MEFCRCSQVLLKFGLAYSRQILDVRKVRVFFYFSIPLVIDASASQKRAMMALWLHLAY